MAVLKPKYDTAGKAVTITHKNLASSTTDGRESTVVDNSTDLYDFVTIRVKATAPDAALGTDPNLYVYAYEQILDAAGNPAFPGNVTGTDGALAAIQENCLVYLGAVPMVRNASRIRNFNLGAAFGGRVPRKWGITIRNACGQTLTNVDADNTVLYFGGWWESVA